MNSLPPYLTDIPQWQTVIDSKHILFDSDAIISLLSYNALEFFHTLKKQSAVNCYIHPVLVEILNTNRDAERALRQTLLDQYSFNLISLTKKDFDLAVEIQLQSSQVDCYPSPTDLYLGAVLARFGHDKILALTANLKDFPHPLFERVSLIVL